MAKRPDPNWSAHELVDSTLLSNNVHYLSGDVDDVSIAPVIKWILHENLIKKADTLTLYINSYGGDMYEALALIDVMKASEIPVHTIGIGSVMSAAFFIFISGNHRTIGQRATAMCHQYASSVEGKHHDLKASIEEGDRLNHEMISLIGTASELNIRTIKSNLLKETDVYLTAQDMLDLGLADTIY